MKVVSLNIGEKRIINYKGRIIETGIFKYPVSHPLMLGFEDVKNDSVVDRRYHGGIDKAVYAYSEEHYAYWESLYPDLDWDYGMFGENITVSSLDETQINIGDTFKVGEAVIKVTKPREPCMKLGLRFGTQKVLKQFWNSTKSGIYFKVLKTGHIHKEDEFTLIRKETETPTIAEVYSSKREGSNSQ